MLCTERDARRQSLFGIRSRLFRALLGALLVVAVVAPLAGQGIPTATLTGKVTAGPGGGVAGVTVSVASPALQGKRTTVTNANGDYIFNLLPAGDYTVTFELQGMQPAEQRVTLSASRTSRVDQDVRPSSVAEAVTVSGAEANPAAILEDTQVAANYKKPLIESLPVGRTLTAITQLAPGVNNNGPSGNDRAANVAITISGGQSFENLFTVDGVVANENLRGQPHDLFIEDAIQETTVLTGSISAEYGRFSGGVVNAITKSGGNTLSGSFRTTFTNDKWTENDPYNNGAGHRGVSTSLADPRVDKVNETYEETLGGPIFRDRLWFFAAGRQAALTDSNQTRLTAGPGSVNPTPQAYTHGTDEKRYEGKLTGAITPQHNVVVNYIDIKNHETNNRFTTNILDLDSLTDRDLPNTLLSANYNGVLSSKVFVEAQYSKKKFTFEGGGCAFTDLERGTLLLDRSRNNARYNCATFSNATPERRDNQSWSAKGSYFLSTAAAGSHDVRVGYEHFKDFRFANNHQSGSDFRIFGTSAYIRGSNVFPVFQNDTSTFIRWTPLFQETSGTDFQTDSVFFNDKIALNKHWSFNLGVRYDRNNGRDSRGFTVSNDHAFSPRLAAQFDVLADGRFVVNAGYAQYVAQLSDSIGDSASPAGQPANFDYLYRGPCINCDPAAPTGSLLTNAQAIDAVFAWFNSVGGTTVRPTRGNPTVPGLTAVIPEGSLKSPNVKEYTVGFGSAIGSRGVAKIDFIYRDWDDFYATRTDLTTGVAPYQFGLVFDKGVIENTNKLDRKYEAVQFQYNYRFAFPLFAGGGYTWSRLTGNFDGENFGSGPITGSLDYPEYLDFARSANNSSGYLAGDQRHRAKLWAGYDFKTSFASFTLTALETVDSGRAYDANALINTRNAAAQFYVANPGYQAPPTNELYYFTARGALRTDTVTRTDLAMNVAVKVFKNLELFIRPELLNVFNEKAFTGGRLGIDSDLTVNTANTAGTAAYSPFNPRTDTPVQGPAGTGANYSPGPNFGKAIAPGGYQLPRTFRASVGVRF
ncbi:MAG: TonB-dependent receptor [Acidobacteriota bacterium]|nr:TonB-dependent receptor [Acidobacteriota bacterium]